MNREALRAALSGGKGLSALFAAAWLAAAGAAALPDAKRLADSLLLAAALPAFPLLLRDIARGLARGHTTRDIPGMLAIGAALALGEWLAGAASALSGDPARALAVLVVATPCPLILAVPVTLTAGLSRAARAGCW